MQKCKNAKKKWASLFSIFYSNCSSYSYYSAYSDYSAYNPYSFYPLIFYSVFLQQFF
jgi:hypothetical protein